MGGIGTPGIIVLVLLALILFGPKKLPEFGRALGNTFREFKKGMNGTGGNDESKPEGAEKKDDQTRLPE
jgi:sec-independent protein translocase protein TatA